MPPARLPDCELHERIGVGGVADVFRGTWRGRDAALKVLPESFTADPDRRARFTREAQVPASLNHPNIAGIYGFEDASGTPVLAADLETFQDGAVMGRSSSISQGLLKSKSCLST